MRKLLNPHRLTQRLVDPRLPAFAGGAALRQAQGDRGLCLGTSPMGGRPMGRSFDRLRMNGTRLWSGLRLLGGELKTFLFRAEAQRFAEAQRVDRRSRLRTHALHPSCAASDLNALRAGASSLRLCSLCASA